MEYNKIDECAPTRELTFGEVQGLPSGKVYRQVLPFSEFVKIPKKKKKRKLEKHSDAEHSPNPPMYKYVDDFRDYAERTKLADKVK